jgi:predicted NAD/FAD-binding protein
VDESGDHRRRLGRSAAAVELAKAGVRVTVFEAAKQLGGRARSVEVQGQRLDNGQHILVGAYRETLRLMQEVGADPERLLKRLPLELSFPAGQPPFPCGCRACRHPGTWRQACSARAASSLSREDQRRSLHALSAGRGYRLGADCTVKALLDRHDQHGSLRRHLWEPLCLAALNTAPEQASAQIFVNTCATVSAVGARQPTCCCRQPTSTSCSRPPRRFIARVAGKSACRRASKH